MGIQVSEIKIKDSAGDMTKLWYLEFSVTEGSKKKELGSNSDSIELNLKSKDIV